jgi:FG-GAP repeat protein
MVTTTRRGLFLLMVLITSTIGLVPTSAAAVPSGPAAISSAAPATSSSQTADFNGDGFSDLAVGVPEENVGAIVSAGGVNVLYGSADGLTSAGSQFWHQDSPGVEDDGAEEGDGFSDLAVGVAFEDAGGFDESSGAVNILYGSSGGLTAAGSQFWHQDSPGVAGDGREDPDFFGWSLGSGDFDGDGFADLAVGVAGEWVGEIVNAGAMNVLYGSAGGLIATGSQFWHQDSTGVAGKAEEPDFFGSSVTAGDFNGDGLSDVAIRVPGEAVGAIGEAGAVNVLYGSPTGLTATGDQLWHQGSPGVAGTPEFDDEFGVALAAANVGKSAHDDLAVGVLYEDIGAIGDAGAVNVLYGSPNGLTATGDQLWHQGSPGVEGRVESGDYFGSSLAAVNFGKSSDDDLAVGVPGEDVGAIGEAGAVNVLYGSSTGLTSTDDQLWHQNSADVIDQSEAGDLLGLALVAADFGNSSQADLVIGVPYEGIETILESGAVNVLYGSEPGLARAGNQFWHQDSPGVSGDGAEEGDRFARSLDDYSFCEFCP